MKKYNEVLSFINTYKTGNYVYQRVIKRRFGIDGMTVYMILEKMADEGVLKRVFTPICSKCSYESDIIYDSLNQISDLKLMCGECKRNMDVLEDVVMLYRKVSVNPSTPIKNTPPLVYFY